MELRFPELSENDTSSTITCWHVHEGEKVLEGRELLEVATDKATLDVPSPYDGVLVKIVKKEGQTVRSGEIIAVIN